MRIIFRKDSWAFPQRVHSASAAPPDIMTRLWFASTDWMECRSRSEWMKTLRTRTRTGLRFPLGEIFVQIEFLKNNLLNLFFYFWIFIFFSSNAMHSGSNRVSINNPKIPIRKLCRFSDLFIYKDEKMLFDKLKFQTPRLVTKMWCVFLACGRRPNWTESWRTWIFLVS